MRIPQAAVPEHRLLGIGLVLMTFAFFTVVDLSAKWMAEAGIPPAQVAFLRFAIHFSVIAGMVLPRYGLGAFATDRPVLNIVRASALLATTTLNFFAVKFLPLTVTGTISFMMPLIVCALSVPLLGEKVGWRRWLAILTGFCGILVIVRPGGAEFHPALFLSFGMVVTGALYFILTRKLAGADSTATLQLYGGLVGTMCLAPFALAVWTWPADPITWIAFFAVGIAALVGHQISIIAHRLAPASTLAPFAYTQIIWMSIASWLVFDQPPTVWLFIGGPVVIASGLYIWLRERELAKPFVSPTSVHNADESSEEKSARERSF